MLRPGVLVQSAREHNSVLHSGLTSCLVFCLINQ